MKVDVVEICTWRGGMCSIRTYLLLPRVRLVEGCGSRPWKLWWSCWSNAGVIGDSGRREVSLLTARGGLSFKRSMITRCRDSSWECSGGEETLTEDRRGPAKMVFLGYAASVFVGGAFPFRALLRPG